MNNQVLKFIIINIHMSQIIPNVVMKTSYKFIVKFMIT